VKENFTAQGLSEAKVKLDHMKLTGKELVKYENYLKNLRDKASEQHTKMADAQELIDKGVKQGKIEVIIEMYKDNFPIEVIAKVTKLDAKTVQQLIQEFNKST
jgi:hypothetical protein